MATTTVMPPETDAPRTYEPEHLYDIQLTQAVEHPPGSNHWVSPANRVQVKGKLAAAWGDRVSDAQAV